LQSFGEESLVFQFVIKYIKIKIYRIIIMPVVLYMSETWPLIMKEGRRLRVFEKRVLRRIFGLKGNEVTGESGKLGNEELHDLHSSSNVIRVMKSRRMRWAEHVAHLGRREVRTGFRWGNLRDRNNLEDQSLDGRLILRWIFRKCDGDTEWLIWFRIARSGKHF
jgi:hypothetical protein